MVKANCPACGTEFEVAEAGVLSAPEAPVEEAVESVTPEEAVEAPVETSETVVPTEEAVEEAVEAPASEEVAG